MYYTMVGGGKNMKKLKRLVFMMAVCLLFVSSVPVYASNEKYIYPETKTAINKLIKNNPANEQYYDSFYCTVR